MAKGVVKALVDKGLTTLGLSVKTNTFEFYEKYTFEGNLVVYIDKSCLGDETKNIDSTIESAKWLIVEKDIFRIKVKAFRKDLDGGKINNKLGKFSLGDIFYQEYLQNNNADIQVYRVIEPDNLKEKGKNQVTINAESLTFFEGMTYYIVPFNFFPEYEGIDNSFPKVKYCSMSKIFTAKFIVNDSGTKDLRFGESVVCIFIVNSFNTFEYKTIVNDSDRRRKIIFLNEIYYLDSDNNIVVVDSWKKTIIEEKERNSKDVQLFQEEKVLKMDWFDNSFRSKNKSIELYYKVTEISNPRFGKKFDSKNDSSNIEYSIYELVGDDGKSARYNERNKENKMHLSSICVDF